MYKQRAAHEVGDRDVDVYDDMDYYGAVDAARQGDKDFIIVDGVEVKDDNDADNDNNDDKLIDKRIKTLFSCAQKGIKRLMDTYKSCSIINLVLTYYYTIITYFIENEPVTNIYQKDGMSILYTNELTNALNSQWTKEKVKVILDLISFLNNDIMANENVKSLENIISSIDKTSQDIIQKI